MGDKLRTRSNGERDGSHIILSCDPPEMDPTDEGVTCIIGYRIGYRTPSVLLWSRLLGSTIHVAACLISLNILRQKKVAGLPLRGTVQTPAILLDTQTSMFT